MKNLVWIALVMFFVSACGDIKPHADTHKPKHATSDVTKVATVAHEGLYEVSGDYKSFYHCESGGNYVVKGSPMMMQYLIDRFQQENFGIAESVYVQFRGEFEEFPTDGKISGYDGVIRVESVLAFRQKTSKDCK